MKYFFHSFVVLACVSLLAAASLAQAARSITVVTEPNARAAEPKPAQVPLLTVESAPADAELRPMPVPYSIEEASLYATNLQKDGSGRFTGEGALVHPGWIAARMTPLLNHSGGTRAAKGTPCRCAWATSCRAPPFSMNVADPNTSIRKRRTSACAASSSAVHASGACIWLA